ncbi:MAG: ABC transporter permease [Phycisphaerales bacterium]|nr:ABC transporter permease [Phycisphaerales bacterium]
MEAVTSTHTESSQTLLVRLLALYRYRELMWMLAWRDIRVRYKHSLLGAAWAVMPPIAMMLIFTFVFSQVIQVDKQKLTGDAALPYSLFAFSGLVPWMFFANGLTNAIGSLVANRPLVTKIYFPREVFPLSAIIGAFVDFLVASVVSIALAVLLHFLPNGWHFHLNWTVVFLPVVVTVQVMFMVGLALLLSMANLFYRDVGFLFRSIIQLWMFVTCVVYQLEATAGWKRVVIQLNPMTPIIRAYRDCLVFGRSPFDIAFMNTVAVSAMVLLVGWWWFRRREFDFAENI